MSSLSFDDIPRNNRTFDAPQRIARVLDDSGLNARATLYDESLALAREGHLSQATERLRMLLVLDPNDADAALLLGKVLASREQWQEALSWLDRATTGGAVLPPGLREKVEAAFHQSVTDAEELRDRLAARERGEVRNLRAEAKRLRSEHAILEAEVLAANKRLRLWSGATAILSGICLALIVTVIAFGSMDSTDAPPTEEPRTMGARALVTPPPTTPAPATPAPAAEEAPTKADKAVDDESQAAQQRVHTVRSGDTLGRISQRYYGTPANWPRIQAANAEQLGDGIDLQVGMELVIPE